MSNRLFQLIFVCLLAFIATYKFWSLYSDDEIVNISKYEYFSILKHLVLFEHHLSTSLLSE